MPWTSSPRSVLGDEGRSGYATGGLRGCRPLLSRGRPCRARCGGVNPIGGATTDGQLPTVLVTGSRHDSSSSTHL